MKLNTMGWCVAGVVAALLGNGVRAMADEVTDRLRNDPQMMPFYTGKILPTPQQATYSAEFIPLAKTGILLGAGITPEDQRVKLLLERIARYGGKAAVVAAATADCETLICLGDTAQAAGVAVPAKDEGYAIRCLSKDGKTLILLKGHDARGLLWAVVSLNQLITYEKGRCVAQKVEVTDYPAIRNRGFVGGTMKTKSTPVISGWPRLRFCSPLNEYIVGFKMNKVCFGPGVIADRTNPEHSWKSPLPEVVLADLRKTGSFLTPLGIEWYVEIQNLTWDTPDLQVRSKNEEDFQFVFKTARTIMDAGGNVGLIYDDLRFDLSPEDVKDFGTAREADVYFLNKLYSALKATYPGRPIKMVFCPPFYWGPDAGHTYPESREEYLAALGERLPPEIGIFWTGGRVKTGEKSKESVEWFSKLIRRKPLLFQNTTGVNHAYYLHYFTDPVPAWRDWHYEGFFDDIDTYMPNVGFPDSAASQLTCADFLWNPKAYNPERSVEEAVKKLCGPESYAALAALNTQLSYFDQFDARVSPNAARNLPAMEQAMAEVDRLWAEAQAVHPAAVEQWCGMAWAIQLQKNFLAEVKKNPDLATFAKNADESRALAVREVKFNPDKDLFLSAYDFVGGASAQYYATRCEKRLATWVYGARSPKGVMRAGFTVDPWPAAADYHLILSGQDNDRGPKCRIRIRVNDKTVFEGENPFVRQGWSTHTFTLPGAALTRSSTLTIQNIEDADITSGPPYFMLNYGVLRKGE